MSRPNQTSATSATPVRANGAQPMPASVARMVDGCAATTMLPCSAVPAMPDGVYGVHAGRSLGRVARRAGRPTGTVFHDKTEGGNLFDDAGVGRGRGHPSGLSMRRAAG